MAYADEVLADTPLAYWKLDETSGTTAFDSSGNGRNLTWTGTPGLGASPLINTGTAVTLSGDDGASRPLDAFTNRSQYSVELWFSSTATASSFLLLHFAGTAGAWGLQLNRPGTTAGSVTARNYSTSVQVSSAAVNNGARHHVVLVQDATTLRLYVDGTQVNSAASAQVNNDLIGINLGQDNTGANKLVGKLDEVAYYGAPLSAARVLAHYNAGIGVVKQALTGAATAASAAAGTLLVTQSLTGSSSAVSSASGALRVTRTLTAAGTAASVAAGSLAVVGVVGLLGGATATATATGDLTIIRTLTGDAAADSVAAGVLTSALPPQIITVGTEPRNLDTSARRRTGTGYVDIDVPVAPEPPSIAVAPLRVAVDTLPVPDIDAGHVAPMVPTTLREVEWGRIRILVANHDVTYLRDKPAQVTDYQLLDPYGYGPATLRFPQVTFWELDGFGTGPLSWLAKNAPVHIDHVHAGEHRRTMWVGHIDAFDFDDDGALVCDCSGELVGRMDKTVRTQRLVRGVHDAGHLARIALSIQNKHYKLSGSADAWSRVGVPMENTGGGLGTNLAFLDYVLANMVDEDLTAWTIMPTTADPRTFDLHRRDYTTVDATVYLGARGVQVRLRDDQLEQPTRMFGEGVGPKGDRWRGAEYPNLGPEVVPPYPYNDGRTFGSVGLTDDDTDTGAGIRVLEDELLGSGLLDLEDRNGEWHLDTTRAVEEVQRRAGLPVTGRVDPDTWHAVFGDGADQQRLTQAHIRPLVWQDATERFRLSPNASVIGRNADYDRNVARIERLVSFGEGVTKARARRWLRREMNRAGGANWRGTITLTSDVLEGDHTFGEPGTAMSRLDLTAGMNIRVKRFGSPSGMLMHVASVQGSGLDGDTPQVELAVDTQFRDAITLAEMLERDKAARADPARRWMNQQRRSTIPSDAMIGWDREAGAGFVRRTPLTGGQWNVVGVIGAQAGEVQRIELTTVNSPAEFICAVFARPVRPGQLQQRIGDPFLDVEPGAVWQRTDVADWLAGLDKTDLEAWRDQQRKREEMRKDADGNWVPPEYEAGNIVRGDNGQWQSVLSPPSGQELADLQAEAANNREERLAAIFEMFSDARAGVYVAGTTEQPCGYWPKSKTNANGNPTGEPITGQWRDDASFSYWTLGPRSPWLYLAVFPDRDCTIFGRMYDQLIEGT